MQRHLDEMTRLKAELTKANMEIAGHAAALKEAELNGAKEVCLVSFFGGMFQLSRVPTSFLVMQVYEAWEKQFSPDVSFAIKASSKLSDYKFEGIRVLLSHEHTSPDAKPTIKKVPIVG